jgi:hypothetical protein
VFPAQPNPAPHPKKYTSFLTFSSTPSLFPLKARIASRAGVGGVKDFYSSSDAENRKSAMVKVLDYELNKKRNRYTPQYKSEVDKSR